MPWTFPAHQAMLEAKPIQQARQRRPARIAAWGSMKQQTQQSYYQRISRVIAEILANPSAPHTVESLATVAHLSPFHFHRIYRALTGEGVAETVRRLRLAQAARHLAQGAGPVTAIALDAGYDSPQAFARAFREFTGVSPTDYQARHGGIAASPAIELVEVQPVEVLCLRHEGPIASIGLTYRKLFALLEGRITLTHPPRRSASRPAIPNAPTSSTELASPPRRWRSRSRASRCSG
jgi:AraC family transcriptional regulator